MRIIGQTVCWKQIDKQSSRLGRIHTMQVSKMSANTMKPRIEDGELLKSKADATHPLSVARTVARPRGVACPARCRMPTRHAES